MSDKDNGGPAFPAAWDVQFKGMTLRDYFAAKAMQSLISRSDSAREINIAAGKAYAIAYAMLEARK